MVALHDRLRQFGCRQICGRRDEQRGSRIGCDALPVLSTGPGGRAIELPLVPVGVSCRKEGLSEDHAVQTLAGLNSSNSTSAVTAVAHRVEAARSRRRSASYGIDDANALVGITPIASPSCEFEFE